jgi:hypothetical protein
MTKQRRRRTPRERSVIARAPRQREIDIQLLARTLIVIARSEAEANRKKADDDSH